MGGFDERAVALIQGTVIALAHRGFRRGYSESDAFLDSAGIFHLEAIRIGVRHAATDPDHANLQAEDPLTGIDSQSVVHNLVAAIGGAELFDCTEISQDRWNQTPPCSASG